MERGEERGRKREERRGEKLCLLRREELLCCEWRGGSGGTGWGGEPESNVTGRLLLLLVLCCVRRASSIYGWMDGCTDGDETKQDVHKGGVERLRRLYINNSKTDIRPSSLAYPSLPSSPPPGYFRGCCFTFAFVRFIPNLPAYLYSAVESDGCHGF